jgi:hypothetical protein
MRVPEIETVKHKNELRRRNCYESSHLFLSSKIETGVAWRRPEF